MCLGSSKLSHHSLGLTQLSLEYTDTGTLVCILAGIFYAAKFKTLSRIEKPIAVVIWLNILCDIISFAFGKGHDISGMAYNILLPLERIITLLVYASVFAKSKQKNIYLVGIIAVGLIRIISLLYQPTLVEFHFVANTVEGLLVAVLSYVFVRSLSARESSTSVIVFAFGLATFLYLTLMASAMSAVQLAHAHSEAYGRAIYGINIIAYIIWSIILITAILWKKRN